MSDGAPGLARDDLDYPLDPARIATEPAEPRDSARMLVVHRDRVEHRRVCDHPGKYTPFVICIKSPPIPFKSKQVPSILYTCIYI